MKQTSQTGKTLLSAYIERQTQNAFWYIYWKELSYTGPAVASFIILSVSQSEG